MELRRFNSLLFILAMGMTTLFGCDRARQVVAPIEMEKVVLIYIGEVSWILPEDAAIEAEITKNKLSEAGIRADVTEDEDDVRQWMLQTMEDGAVNVLMLYGVMPSTVYPPPNALPDGSVAENWIETPDGNTILNQADYFGYYSEGDTHRVGRESEGRLFEYAIGVPNYKGCLQNLMDHPTISTWGDNTLMVPTPEGRQLTPSLVDFASDRPFPLDDFQGNWFAEKIFATDSTGTRADPVIIRDGNLGRIAVAHMTDFRDDPKGEVAAELILNYLLLEFHERN